MDLLQSLRYVARCTAAIVNGLCSQKYCSEHCQFAKQNNIGDSPLDALEAALVAERMDSVDSLGGSSRVLSLAGGLSCSACAPHESCKLEAKVSTRGMPLPCASSSAGGTIDSE